jgi:hypothetical protein
VRAEVTVQYVGLVPAMEPLWTPPSGPSLCTAPVLIVLKSNTVYRTAPTPRLPNRIICIMHPMDVSAGGGVCV